MEGMDDGTESERVKQVTEGPPTKVTDVVQGLLIDRNSRLESQPEIASAEHVWPDELSSLRSFLGQNMTGLFLGSQFGLRRSCDTSKEENLPHSCSTSGHDGSFSNTEIMVEELTVRNYKAINVTSVDVCLNAATVRACDMGQGQSKRVQLQRLYEMVGQGNTSLHARPLVEPTVNHSSCQFYDNAEKEKLEDITLHETGDQTTVAAQDSCQEPETAAENPVRRDKYLHSRRALPMQMLGEELHTRAPLPSSGFSEFFAKRTLKGKGLAIKDLDPVKKSNTDVRVGDSGKSFCFANISADVTQSSAAFAGASTLLCDPRVGHDSLEYGINLREWLGPRSHKLHTSKRLIIFRQIVELVNLAHSQGTFIKGLQPSRFIVSSDNQVKYIGPTTFNISPPGLSSNNDFMNSSIDGSMKRKRQQQLLSIQGDMKHENKSVGPLCSYDTPTMKHLKLSNQSRLSNQHHLFSSQCWSKPESVTDGASKSRLATHDTLARFTHTESTNQPQQPFIAINKHLEDMWYTSPEDVSDKPCSLSSNIYSLGVLLFELFCCSESWEVHASLMSDLRHRILPPTFLAENPKEAGFCLWLLHPDPLSRPQAW